MKRILIATVLVLASAGVAYAAEPAAVAQLVQSCCDAMAACCCCP